MRVLPIAFTLATGSPAVAKLQRLCGDEIRWQVSVNLLIERLSTSIFAQMRRQHHMPISVA
jgi:hypothetical protein